MNKRIVSVTAIVVLMAITVFTVASSILVHQVIASPAISTREPTLGVLPSEVAYFKVGFPTDDVTFTIMLTDTEKIEEARDIASGVQTDTVSVMGTIVKMPAPYNPYWGYHLAPESIQFFDTAVEVCDAHPYYVEEHLDEVCGAFLPGCVWCPFSSRVITQVRISAIFLPLVVVDSLAEENAMDCLQCWFIGETQVDQSVRQFAVRYQTPLSTTTPKNPTLDWEV